VATWNDFWDFSLIAATQVDTVITMDTYVNPNQTAIFEANLIYAVKTIGIAKLGVGFDSDVGLTDDDLTARFNLLHQYGALEVDIWEAPIPDSWWPYLQNFLSS